MKIAGTCKPAGRRGRIKGGSKSKSKRAAGKQPKGTGARRVVKKQSETRSSRNNRTKPRKAK